MATVVGEAVIIATLDSSGLKEQLAADADEAGVVAADAMGDAGIAAGGAYKDGVKSELSDMDDVYAGSVPTGVTEDAEEQGKKDAEQDAKKDVEKDGGFGSGLLSGLGVPEALTGGWGKLAITVGATAAAAADLGVKFQSNIAGIANAEGITTKAAQAVGNAMLATAGQVEFSADEQAKAFASVAGQLRSVEGHALSTKQSMEFMGEAMKLATATGTDLATSTGAIAGVLQAFSLGVEHAGEVSNILFNTANATGLSIDSLSGSLAKMRARLGDAAPPLGQMSGLMIDLTDHGETGRMAMTGLASMMNTLIKPTADARKAQVDMNAALAELPANLKGLAQGYAEGKVTSEQFYTATENLSGPQAALVEQFRNAADAVTTANTAQKELGVTVLNGKGQFVGMASVLDQLNDKIKGMSDQQAIAELSAIGFGSSAARVLSIVKAGPEAYDKATAAAQRHNAVEKAEERQAHTVSVEWHTMIAYLSDLGVTISKRVLPVAKIFINDLLELVHVGIDVVKFAMKYKEVLIVLGGVLVNLMLPSLGTMVGTLASFVTGIPAAIAGMFGFGEAAETAGAASATAFGPIGLIIAAIGIAVYEVIKHWSAIEAFFVHLWGDVERIFEGFLHFVESTFDAVVHFVESVWDHVRHDAAAVVDAIVHFFEGIPHDIAHVFDEIRHDISAAWDWFGNETRDLIEKVVHFFESLPDKIIHIIEHASGDVLKAFEKWIPGGGLIGGALHMIGLAEGGVVHKPTIAVIGEAGPEAVIPLKEFGNVGGAENIAGLPSRGGGNVGGAAHGDMHVYIQQPNMTAAQLEAELSFLLRSGQLAGI